jgi:nitric oxide reductase activation protein
LISSWAVFDKTLCWYPEAPRQEKKTQQPQKQSSAHLSKTTIQNIEERLAYNSTDITPIIRSVVGHDNKDIVPTSRWDFNIPAHPVIDYKLVARLKGILQNYSDQRTVLNRGLTAGRVDRRKLYRAPINGRCFMEKQKIPLLDWNICLLVDATGSMKGPRWRMVENTLGTMHKAFSGFENRLQSYAYFEVEGVCMISSLIKKNRILSIPPCGQTASGQAIIAAAHFMPDDKRRRFIIHITDGESNFGCDVRFGIDHCRTSHIHLVTLGVAYKDRDAMQKQYGRTIQFVDHFGQLPSAIEKLLKWTLLNNKTHAAQLGI